MLALESKKVINFIEYSPTFGRNIDFGRGQASINCKSGVITFPKKTIEGFGWQNQFMKFYYEPTKKIIGWKVRPEIKQEEMKTWSLAKQAASGQVRVSIGGILKSMNFKKAESFHKLEIEKWNDTRVLSEGDTYYFVKLK